MSKILSGVLSAVKMITEGKGDMTGVGLGLQVVALAGSSGKTLRGWHLSWDLSDKEPAS